MLAHADRVDEHEILVADQLDELGDALIATRAQHRRTDETADDLDLLPCTDAMIVERHDRDSRCSVALHVLRG